MMSINKVKEAYFRVVLTANCRAVLEGVVRCRAARVNDVVLGDYLLRLQAWIA